MKKQVESCLKRFPETRNSDIELTIKVWKEYFPQRIVTRQADGKDYVEVRSLFDLPREDNVKRIRAKFNEFGHYLPTSWEVAKQRRISEGQWRAYIQRFPIEDSSPEVHECEHGTPTFAECPYCEDKS